MSSTAETRKGRATRERIVASAAQLMQQHGVAGTGTADVRRTAGVSASQIYHYFADKDGLVRAVVDHQVDRVVGAQTAALAEVRDLDALRAWRDAVLAGAASDGLHGCPVGSLAGELVEDSPWAREALAAGFGAWHDALEGAVRRTLPPGADDEAVRLAAALLAAVQGGLLLAEVTGSLDHLAAGLDVTLAQVARLVGD